MFIVNAQELYNKLCEIDFSNNYGNIVFNLAGITVKVNTTDTVGVTIQSWLKEYLNLHNIYFSVPNNTQEFPDFYLNPDYPNENMLEVKAFNYNASPAFDIANFESYCHSVKNKVYRLNADYLIFGYTMNFEGNIKIEKIWLKKIWEIAGNSRRYPLKTQIKRNMIYNIRPNNSFKEGKNSIFKCKEDFLFAIYKTLLDYKGKDFAEFWKENLAENYKEYFGYELNF